MLINRQKNIYQDFVLPALKKPFVLIMFQYLLKWYNILIPHQTLATQAVYKMNMLGLHDSKLTLNPNCCDLVHDEAGDEILY